jgi:hypothetical protein
VATLARAAAAQQDGDSFVPITGEEEALQVFVLIA